MTQYSYSALDVERLCVTARRIIVAAPHPDDDVIGAAVLIRRALQRAQHVTIVFATTGVPIPTRLASQHLAAHGTYEQYSERRAAETRSALAKYGDINICSLGFHSREVLHKMQKIESTLLGLITDAAGTVLLAPSFEGGHPDHDVLGCICDVVSRKSGVPCLEYLGYHWREGQMRCQEFWPRESSVWELQMTPEDTEFKKACLRCHASQWGTILHKFHPDREAFRIRPYYNYQRSELGERLFYEVWDCGISATDVLDACNHYRKVTGE